MKKILTLLLIIIHLYSCGIDKNINNIIKIEQIKSNYPIIIRCDIETGKIFAVDFLLAYKIKKNSSQTVYVLQDCGYYYGDKYSGECNWYGGNILYLSENGKFNKLGNIEYNYKEHVVHNQHYNLSKKEAIQQMFQPYIEKMKRENKDTLHIESIQQLKKINPELVNGFLQGDSIKFRIRFPDAKDIKLEQIKLPVEVK